MTCSLHSFSSASSSASSAASSAGVLPRRRVPARGLQGVRCLSRQRQMRGASRSPAAACAAPQTSESPCLHQGPTPRHAAQAACPQNRAALPVRPDGRQPPMRWRPAPGQRQPLASVATASGSGNKHLPLSPGRCAPGEYARAQTEAQRGKGRTCWSRGRQSPRGTGSQGRTRPGCCRAPAGRSCRARG